MVFFAGTIAAKAADCETNGNLLIKYSNGDISLFDSCAITGIAGHDPREIEYVEPDYKYQAAILPTESFYKNQWYLEKIKAPLAWDLKRESPDIVIAIIDSGVDASHPDLRDNIWINENEIPGNGADDDRNGFIDDINGWDFVNGVSDPSPKFSGGFTDSGVMHGMMRA
jgi:subtilisin family serine protease